MRYIVFLFLWIASCGQTVAAQNENEVDSSAIVTNSVWSNWFGQLGIDMSLQNPYGCNFAHVFPNGKSYGIDAAFEKDRGDGYLFHRKTKSVIINS